MPKFKPYFDIDLSRNYSPEERQAIAAEIIDFVVSRTENGLDKNNEKFVKYSKSYAKEKGQTNVDLTFSGEMLSAISLLQSKSGKLRIGYESDYEEIGRVTGNVLGTYGNQKPVTKGRDFLGLTEKDLNRILKNYPLNDKEAREERLADVKAADIVAREILGRTGFEEFEEDD